MTRAIDLPEKDSLALVFFKFGDPADPQFRRYTDWGQDAVGHTSVPDMKITLPPNTGSFGGQEAKIELPLNEFTSPIATQSCHSPVYVSIVEYIRPLDGGPNATQLNFFKGRLQYSKKNYQGRRDTVMLTFLGVKSRLDVKLGLPGNHHCVWNLFGRGCGLIEATFARSGQIATIVGRTVTITTPNTLVTAPTSPGGNVDRYWERGYMRYQGLNISIHKWELTNPTVFVLKKTPPPTWLLAGATSIRLVPGCHKTIEDCRDVWDNEGQFMGFGYKVPTYNPIFESDV